MTENTSSDRYITVAIQNTLLSLDLTLTEGQRLQDALTLLNCKMTAPIQVKLALQGRQSTHDDLLHLIRPLSMSLTLLPRLFQLHPDLPVLLAVCVIALLQFVDFPKQQLVLILEVRVFALQDPLDSLIPPRVVHVAFIALEEGKRSWGLQDVSVGDAGVGLGGIE